MFAINMWPGSQRALSPSESHMKTAPWKNLKCVGMLALCFPVLVASRPAYAQSSATPPDNSAQNKTQNTTADNQPNARQDRLTTAAVRRAIIADKTLSVYAHNVKIITLNGAVTLNGPVKSADEKQKVATDAASAVAPDKIANQLTVKQ